MHNQVARTLRIVVYTLLLASTAVAIFFNERPRQLWGEGELPLWAPYVAPVSFALFTLVFGLDRLFAVRRQHYAPTRALMQVACALLLLTLLLPARPVGPRPSTDGAPSADGSDGVEFGLWPAQLLLQYEDDAVRQAACELLAGEALGVPHPLPPGHPMEALRGLLVELTEEDAVAEVRQACGRALGQLAPLALEPEEDDALSDGDPAPPGGPNKTRKLDPSDPESDDQQDDDDDEDEEDETDANPVPGAGPWQRGQVTETL